MLLGALIDAGLDEHYLATELKKIGLPGLDLRTEKQSISGIVGVKVFVGHDKRQRLRTLPAIRKLLNESGLARDVVEKSIQIFETLGRAEAKVHGVELDTVHFHEVGAVDTIVDIVGVVLGLQQFGVTSLSCSPLPFGTGFIHLRGCQ